MRIMNNMGILEDFKIKPLSSALSYRNSSRPLKSDEKYNLPFIFMNISFSKIP